MAKNIALPLTDRTLDELRAGDDVLLSGVIYVARDAAHRRMIEALDQLGCVVVNCGANEAAMRKNLSERLQGLLDGWRIRVRLDDLRDDLRLALDDGRAGEGARACLARR